MTRFNISSPFDSVQLRFESRTFLQPDAIAVIHEDHAVSYECLNQCANLLAHHLISLGVGPEIIAPLYVERSIEMIVGILGVLKAGGAYLPLDPSYPRERLAYMLADTKPPILLTQRSLLSAMPTTIKQAICLDSDWSAIAAHGRTNNPVVELDLDNLCYVIYTSGSTGRPKGTLICHRNVLRLFDATNSWFEMDECDVWTLCHSYAFDFSVWEIFGALLHGGRLVVTSRRMTQSPEALWELMIREQVTVLNQTPSSFFNLIHAHQGKKVQVENSSLSLVVFGGEALDPAALRAWFLMYGDEKPFLVNMYGITETTVHVTYRPLTIEDTERAGVSMIGEAIPDLQVYIVDSQMNLVPDAIPGELQIGGAGLARGYLNLPELVAERFVPNPFSTAPGARLYRSGDLGRYGGDGDLEYLGRMDQQVKIRGFRVELGEIERSLLRHQAIRSAVVIATERGAGDRRFVAYVTLHPVDELNVHDSETKAPEQNFSARNGESSRLIPQLREFLNDQLPDYMIPSAFVILDRLPLTLNGKIDREALPDPGIGERLVESARPQTPVEEIVATIFAEMLELEEVGVDQNFFESGGHSLLAVQVITRIREALGVEMSTRDLFENPTVAGLVHAIEILQMKGGELAGPPILPRGRNQPLPLSFAQQRLWYLQQLDPLSAAYNIPIVVRLRGEVNIVAAQQCLKEISRRHEILRTRYEATGGRPRQVIEASGEIAFQFLDIQELREPQCEEQARAIVDEETARPFDLENGPIWRTNLLRLSGSNHVLLVCLHHIASDGWSTDVLVREFNALYEAYGQGIETPLAELPLQYADYALWQREWLQGEALDRELEFWREQLRGMSSQELPSDKPRALFTGNKAAYIPFEIPGDLAVQLKALSRKEGVTTFMTLLAGFNALLSHYSSLTDIVIGTSIANRTRTEIENLIGFFINQLPLRIRHDRVKTFQDLLERARTAVLLAVAHQDFPFERLVEYIAPERKRGDFAHFEAKLILQNAHQGSLELANVQVEFYGFTQPALRSPLYIELHDTSDGLRGMFHYSPELFEADTITMFIEQLKEIYSIVSSAPDIEIHLLYQRLFEIKTRHQEEHKKKEQEKRSDLWKSMRASKGEFEPTKQIISSRRLVACGDLKSGQEFPLVIRPLHNNLDLSEWASHNKEFINEKLRKFGAILFRGFPIRNLNDFRRFTMTFSGELMSYDEPTTPRTLIGENVYTSTDYPASQRIPLHNERSYSLTVPQKLFFWCQIPPESGGETPLCDSRRVLKRIDPSIAEKFIENGWMYVRNFSEELGLRWQTIFGSDSRATVEEYCGRNGIEYEWKANGRLTTRQIRPAIIRHPETGDVAWFNHIAFFHISTIDAKTRTALLSSYGDEGLPNNTYYGDGSPIEDSVIQRLHEAYDQETALFSWQKGDLVLIDNLIAGHGRASYSGPRKILFAMAEPYTRQASIHSISGRV